MTRGRWTIVVTVALMVASPAVAGVSGGGSPLPVVGVVSVTPVLGSSCLAVEVPLAEGQALAGVRWYNNDAAAVFPQVLVGSGDPGTAPDLTGAQVVAEQVAGPSAGWGEVTFAMPVGSANGQLFVVFRFPAFAERDGGNGPGLGYVSEGGGLAGLASLDGVEWVRMGCLLAVQPILTDWAAGMTTLSGDADQEGAANPADCARTGLTGVSPNPFNPSTTVAFTLSAPCRARVAVYRLDGRRVAILCDELLAAGEHTRTWHGVDARGRLQGSGVYLIRLEADGLVFTQRMSLVR